MLVHCPLPFENARTNRDRFYERHGCSRGFSVPNANSNLQNKLDKSFLSHVWSLPSIGLQFGSNHLAQEASKGDQRCRIFELNSILWRIVSVYARYSNSAPLLPMTAVSTEMPPCLYFLGSGVKAKRRHCYNPSCFIELGNCQTALCSSQSFSGGCRSEGYYLLEPLEAGLEHLFHEVAF